MAFESSLFILNFLAFVNKNTRLMTISEKNPDQLRTGTVRFTSGLTCHFIFLSTGLSQNFVRVDNFAVLWDNQARTFRQLENQHGFWNRSTFLNKHLILSTSLKEPWNWNSVTTSLLVQLGPCPDVVHFPSVPAISVSQLNVISNALYLLT